MSVAPKLNSKKNQAAALTLGRGDRSMRANLIRDRIGEIRRLNQKVADVDGQIAGKVKESGTTLTSLPGVGFVLAAKILGEVGDPFRIHSQGAFAMLTGTAPIEASSGATKRHRLNPGGNRQLNHALHMMARARLRHDDDTNIYVARRQTEGKSAKEAVRCLKRHLSNVIFRQPVADKSASRRPLDNIEGLVRRGFNRTNVRKYLWLAPAFRVCSASELQTVLALFRPERSGHPLYGRNRPYETDGTAKPRRALKVCHPSRDRNRRPIRRVAGTQLMGRVASRAGNGRGTPATRARPVGPKPPGLDWPRSCC
jgi:hypothetical protein